MNSLDKKNKSSINLIEDVKYSEWDLNNNKKINLEKIVKEHGFVTIDDLKRQEKAIIDKFMKETARSYFEVFIEPEIEDIRESIEKDEIKIIRMKYGSKQPKDKDYYNKNLTWEEILTHNGNFGVCPGYNHEKNGYSLACIDIDGIKKQNMNKKQKDSLSSSHVRTIENLSEEKLQDIKYYLMVCLAHILPNAMIVQTQSGGYHIFTWNKTHLSQNLKDKAHYISQRLTFPEDCPIEEIRGLSLFNSLEIFTTFKSKPIVLAGSFIVDKEREQTRFYKVMDVSENIRTFAELGTVDDINETVRNGFIELGFGWDDKSPQETESGNQSSMNKNKKESILNPYGILKTLIEEEIEEAVVILLPFFEDKNLEGVAHYTVLAFGGYFCHTIVEESAIQIIKRVLERANYKEEDIKAGIRAIKENYKRKGRKTGLKTAFKNIQDQLGLTNNQTESLKSQLQNICFPSKDKANKTEQDLEILIKRQLCSNQNPSAKLLADYINMKGSYFMDYETGNKYKLTSNGFEEIQLTDISLFVNNKFGDNKISLKTCENVLSFFTKPIETNYDLIIFGNGTLNTKTKEFKRDFYPTGCLPKIITPLNYIENAKPLFFKTDLYNEFHRILKPARKGWDWNEDMYYKCVGVSAMAINESDCFFIINGVPETRKTTLLTPLKRFFRFSEIKLQIIAKNERFQLIPCIRKDINIDDDLSDTVISNSAYLKTFISGAGGSLERKGENIFAEFTAETTPIIWGASNELPTIKGEGMERRTCLILAENPIKKSKASKQYQRDILDGARDEEIELMISYSIQLYMDLREEPFLTNTQQSSMLKEWEWKSSPAKKCATMVFMDSDQFIEHLKSLEEEGLVKNIKHDERANSISYDKFLEDGKIWADVEKKTWTPVSIVNKEFKKFHKACLKNGKIFREFSKPKKHEIKEAMENAGYFQSKKNILNEEGEKEQVRIYEDCIIKPNWEEYLNR